MKSKRMISLFLSICMIICGIFVISAGQEMNAKASGKVSYTETIYWKVSDGTLYLSSDKTIKDGKTKIGDGTKWKVAKEAPGWLKSKSDIKSAKATTKMTVKYAYQWFKGCKNLKSADLSKLDVSKAKSTKEMFDGCSSLSASDLKKIKSAIGLKETTTSVTEKSTSSDKKDLEEENDEKVKDDAEKTYKVTWENDDESVLDTSEGLKTGETPKYAGKTPQKESTSQYTYEFCGWKPEITEIKDENQTYTAQYKSTLRSYTVKAEASESTYGTVSPAEVKDVDYGTEIKVEDNKLQIGDTTITATPAAETADYSYAFSKWEGVSDKVTGELTVTAVFTRTPKFNSYTITWKNYDGTVLKTDEEVREDTIPSYSGDTPTKPSDDTYDYTFDSWTPTIVKATENATYIATYNKTEKSTTKQYTVTITAGKNGYGKVSKTSVTVDEGTEFSTSGKTLTIGTTKVTATPTTATTNYTYAFDSWDPEEGTVDSDMTITANFTRTAKTKTYTVTWKNYDGTVLETDKNVAAGSTPQYNSATPTRAATSTYTYKFKSWSPTISKVTKNVTYKATFTATPVTATKYTVTFYDGTTRLYSTQVASGSTASYNGTSTVKTGYIFKGWYSDSACTKVFNLSTTKITGNTTLYGKWEASSSSNNSTNSNTSSGSGTSSSSTNKTSTPTTGDSTNLTLLYGILIVSALVLIFAGVKVFRKKK